MQVTPGSAEESSAGTGSSVTDTFQKVLDNQEGMIRDLLGSRADGEPATIQKILSETHKDTMPKVHMKD